MSRLHASELPVEGAADRSRTEADDAIRIQQLTVRYDDVVVLDNISMSVATNRWTALLGRNGAGKSSLIAAIVGVGLGAESVSFPLNSGRRQTFCAYVPQSPILPAGMTVSEYVLLGRTAHLGWFAAEGTEDRLRASVALRELGIERFADRQLNQLSGGEAQRAVLARALCQDARILVLDEPTSSLDVGHQIEVMELVAALARTAGITVLSALHDLTAAARYADDVVLLDEARVAAAGPATEVLTSDILTRHYGTPMHRMDGPDGSPVIVPLHAPTPRSPQ